MAKNTISCEQLKKKLDESEKVILIDVREPEEFELAQIEGSILIPLSEFEDHIDELDKDKSYILHCKKGARSEKAADILKQNGFKDIQLLDGGIVKWAEDIEKTMKVD